MTKQKPQGVLVTRLSPMITLSINPHLENRAYTWSSVV